MVVATTPGLNGVRVDNFGTCLGNRWGIGDKDRDDGVPILIAPKERQMLIATGSGMENILPDDKALEIVQQMTPHFRSEERRVGKECVSTCNSRWSPNH